jgi:hypothetical protein
MLLQSISIVNNLIFINSSPLFVHFAFPLLLLELLHFQISFNSSQISKLQILWIKSHFNCHLNSHRSPIRSIFRNDNYGQIVELTDDLISFHFVSSHLISSHLMSSHVRSRASDSTQLIWCHMISHHTMSGNMIICEMTLCHIRSDQMRSDEIRSDQIRSHQITSDQITSDHVNQQTLLSTFVSARWWLLLHMMHWSQL